MKQLSNTRLQQPMVLLLTVCSDRALTSPCLNRCHALPAQNRIQGFGSSNASESNGRSGSRGAYDGIGGADNGDDGGDGFSTASTGLGSKKMEGFGNPRYAASSGYRPAARGNNSGGMAAAAWEGAMSGASTALAGAGTALQGASSAFSNGPLSGATTVLTGAGNALSNAGNALTGALSPKASAAAGRTREARPMLDAVRRMALLFACQLASAPERRMSAGSAMEAMNHTVY